MSSSTPRDWIPWRASRTSCTVAPSRSVTNADGRSPYILPFQNTCDSASRCVIARPWKTIDMNSDAVPIEPSELRGPAGETGSGLR
jgi:hypothetical protein